MVLATSPCSANPDRRFEFILTTTLPGRMKGTCLCRRDPRRPPLVCSGGCKPSFPLPEQTQRLPSAGGGGFEPQGSGKAAGVILCQKNPPTALLVFHISDSFCASPAKLESKQAQGSMTAKTLGLLKRAEHLPLPPPGLPPLPKAPVISIPDIFRLPGSSSRQSRAVSHHPSIPLQTQHAGPAASAARGTVTRHEPPACPVLLLAPLGTALLQDEGC